jgi:hypothetical protein
MKKRILIGVLVILMVILFGLVMASGRIRVEGPVIKEAVLYAVKPDSSPVFKDTDGDLWEISWLTNVGPSDRVLLEINDGAITRTWLEVTSGNGKIG